MMLFIVDPRPVCLSEFYAGIGEDIIQIEIGILQPHFPVAGIAEVDIRIVIHTVVYLMGIECDTHIAFGIISKVGFDLEIVTSRFEVGTAAG